MSLMCTSTASKPARSKAAAISTWPLTPCSRSIATRGRAPRADEGRRHVLGRVEAEAGREAGVGVVQDARRIPPRAQSGLSRSVCIRKLVSDQRRCRALRWARRRARARRRRCARRRPRPARRAASATSSWRCRVASTRSRSARPRLEHDAELLVEERREDARLRGLGPASGARSMRRPVRPANAISASVTKRPPSERSWYASTRPSPPQLGERGEEARAASAGSSRSGASWPLSPKTCARIEPPSRAWPRPRSTSRSSVSPASLRSCGVERAAHVDARARRRRPRATAAPDLLRLAALLPRRAHRERVLADRDADAQRGTQLERHGLHGVVERGVLAGRAGGRHPVGRELHARERRRPAAAARLVSASATAIRPEAGASSERDRGALADRERLAGVALEATAASTAQSATGTCHGPDHRVAGAQPADRAVADRDQEGLVRHRRVQQHAADGLGELDSVRVERPQLRSQRGRRRA